ncbi:MAG: thermonuclease family protein [Candidatus Accumulibacter sp.]|nr:thermonuclease family protein [Accumulibacter sp.]
MGVAPEKAQAFGTKSRQALAAAVFKQPVTVRTNGLDRYGRTIGTILVDGRSINRMMVAEGMAWAYRRYLVGVASENGKNRTLSVH